MSYVTLRTVIETRLNTNWTYTPIQYPNKVFDPNDSAFTKTFDPGGDYIRLAINTGASVQIGIGNPPLKRVSGVIAISIFVPHDAGHRNVDTYVDYVRSIFEDQSFSGVICRATERVIVGKTESWYQVNANTSFDYDYT